MAQRSIREVDAKKIIARELGRSAEIVLVDAETDWMALARQEPWLERKRLVVKPDQCFGKRGKNNLVLLNASFDEAKRFVEEKLGRVAAISKAKGTLTHFLVEPFVPHDANAEYYLAVTTERDCDKIFFSTKGGIEVEENWDNVVSFEVPIGAELQSLDKQIVLGKINPVIAEFIASIYKVFVECGFAFLELNPFVFDEASGEFVLLDAVARLDDASAFENSARWGFGGKAIEFPTPFGREFTAEERFIKELDEKSGASLKLTLLNPEGRVWPLVAGGGASVIYADTIVDLGFGSELAEYGEYSGNPGEEETYLYAKTLLDLMTRESTAAERRSGRVLLVGGGIANFTDVAKTFAGIIRALKEFAPKLRGCGAKIFVRRGGPNYEEGLKRMRILGEEIGVPTEVYGPETHMTKIVPLALEWLKRQEKHETELGGRHH